MSIGNLHIIFYINMLSRRKYDLIFRCHIFALLASFSDTSNALFTMTERCDFPSEILEEFENHNILLYSRYCSVI